MDDRLKRAVRGLGGILLAYALVLQAVLAVPLASRHDLAMAGAAALDEHALCLSDTGAPAPAGEADHHEPCCLAACAVGTALALAPAVMGHPVAERVVAVAAPLLPDAIVLPSRGAGRGPAPRAPPVDMA